MKIAIYASRQGFILNADWNPAIRARSPGSKLSKFFFLPGVVNSSVKRAGNE